MRVAEQDGSLMGMFDWYEPRGLIRCPVCGGTLSEWQGKDGPCLLLVWRQGGGAPVDQRVDEEWRAPETGWRKERLPGEFGIYSFDCGCPYPVEAAGRTEDGVWTQTRLVTAGDDARRRGHERRGERKARLRWLRGRAV